MAAMRNKTQVPVGSIHWVYEEREHADGGVAQEVEEFAYSVRNDIEWLNEHMAEIFGHKEFDVGDILKTPGKLIGKTPRTAQKQQQEPRAPLTDIFASQSRPPSSPALEKRSVIQKPQVYVAEDKENQGHPYSPRHQIPPASGNQATDSGYHEMSEDEMGYNLPTGQSERIASQNALPPAYSEARPNSVSAPGPSFPRKSRSETAESFVSAKEDQNNKVASRDSLSGATSPGKKCIDMNEIRKAVKAVLPHDHAARQSHQYSVSATTAAGLDDALERVERETPVRPSHNPADDDFPSHKSSPQQPIIRKKSSFASLPAREPLAGTKSIGGRVSQSQVRDSTKVFSTTRESALGKVHSSESSLEGQQRLGHKGDEIEIMDIDADVTADVHKPNSETSNIHSKTSTQKLHEKFSMLGKTSYPKPSKSTLSIAPKGQTRSQANAHPTSAEEVRSEQGNVDDIDDDWIGPMKHQAMLDNFAKDSNAPKPSILDGDNYLLEDAKPLGKVGTAIPNPQTNSQEPLTGTMQAYPTLKPFEPESTTPVGSPAVHWKNDGPLSASKAKFNSFLKSARGMFVSSAATSAQAKMETLSPAASRPKLHSKTPLQELFTPNIPMEGVDEAGTKPLPLSQHEDLRSVVVKDPKETTLTQEVDMDINPDGDEKVENANRSQDQVTDDDHWSQTKKAHLKPQDRIFQDPICNSLIDKPEDAMTQPKPKKFSSVPHTKLGEARRPVKQSKNETTKARPAAMSIRVGSQKINQHANHSTSAQSTNHDPGPASSTMARLNQVEKKASNSSLRTASTQVSKGPGGPSSTRLKALEAADRKRERDEREAQRKAEQKRKIEEERRQAQAQKQAEQQQLKAAEHQRMLDARANAQKQAAEQRKLELQRRDEQAHNKTQKNHLPGQDRSIRNQDGLLNQSQPRQEGGLIRPLSRAQNVPQEHAKPPQPHINPAKPPVKRQFQPEPEEQLLRLPQAPQPGPFTTHNAKRRRTSEESATQGPSRPTMAPPIRLSRKDLTTKFSQNFMTSASQQGPSMLKTAVNAAHQAQHPKTPHINDITKYSKAPIPFAEPSDPQNPSHQYPHRPSPPNAKKLGTTAKPSPHYPNGDNISLPEIATDSEESDDDNDFEPPDWANSPELRQLLQQQQLVDPMKVFGPIAPLAMEEVFKGNMERQAKFRARTSSANWTGADRLTEEERRKDIEARERMERDGGWSFNTNT